MSPYIILIPDFSVANFSNICSSAKWVTGISCPSSSASSEFAEWNSTIRDTPTWSIRRWCTAYRPWWIPTVLRRWIWGTRSPCEPLQRAPAPTPTPANYEPNHTGGTSRHTGKPTRELQLAYGRMILKLYEQEVVLKLVNMRPEEIAMLPPTERASVIQLVRLDLSCW